MPKILVNEIFYSLQGEGYGQGLPTVFVRLQGCNLNPGCTYCDTGYARRGGGEALTAKEVVDRVVWLSPHTGTRVCITGGEPLLQEEGLGELVSILNRYLYYIEVFTNGSLPKPSWWTRVTSWVVDIKAPSSGVVSTYASDWIKSRYSDQVKVTVGTSEDLSFSAGIVEDCATKHVRVMVSPVANLLLNISEGTVTEFWNRDWLQEVTEFCLDKRVGLSLQWHKLIWGDRKGA